MTAQRFKSVASIEVVGEAQCSNIEQAIAPMPKDPQVQNRYERSGDSRKATWVRYEMKWRQTSMDEFTPGLAGSLPDHVNSSKIWTGRAKVRPLKYQVYLAAT